MVSRYVKCMTSYMLVVIKGDRNKLGALAQPVAGGLYFGKKAYDLASV